MTYDRRTSRANRQNKARFTAGLIATLVLFCVTAIIFTLHPYAPSWTGRRETMRKLASNFSYEEFIPPSTKITATDSDPLGLLSGSFSLEFPSANGVEPWTIESQHPWINRESLIQNFLKRGRSRIEVREIKGANGLFVTTIEPQLQPGSKFVAKALALLPGETLQWNSTPEMGATAVFFVRCLGATPDRFDATSKISVSFGAFGETSFDVSPRGDLHRIEIPVPEGVSTLRFTWDNSAPGALFVLGNERPKRDSTKPGLLFVTVDDLAMNSLDTLPRTFLKLEQIFGKKNLVDLDSMYRAATHPENNLVSVFSARLPVDTGVTLDSKEDDTDILSLPPEVEKLAAETATKLKRVQVGTPTPCTNGMCWVKGTVPHFLGISTFDSLLEIHRKQELRNAGLTVLARHFSTDKAFVHLNISLPQDQFSLTWKTALQSKTSVFKWLAGGISKAVLPLSFVENLQGEEKITQVDELMASLLSSLPVASFPDVVLLLQRTTKTPSLSGMPGLSGRLVVASRKALQATAKLHPSGPAMVSQRSVLAVIKSLRAEGNKNESAQASASDQNAKMKGAVHVPDFLAIQDSEGERFLFKDGWYSDLGETNQNSAQRLIPLERLFAMRSHIAAFRKSYKIHRLNFMFPARPLAGNPGLELTLSNPPKHCATSLESARVTSTRDPTTSHLRLIIEGKLLSGESWLVSCVFTEGIKGEDTFQLQVYENSLPVPLPALAFGASAVAFPWNTSAGEEGKLIMRGSHFSDFAAAQYPPEILAFDRKAAFIWKDAYPRGMKWSDLHKLDITVKETAELEPEMLTPTPATSQSNQEDRRVP